ncbi:sensor histidine kinase [Spirosoma flavum]|uniref:histidine kinase n=1 Tax=Spirosoma flavum TaxID=2048557 RepID=A0ABW6AL09_9BACT
MDLLFEKSTDCIGIYDLNEGRFIRVNQAGVRLLGFSSEQALLADPVRSRSLRSQPLKNEQQANLIERIVQAGVYEETVQIGRLNSQSFLGKLTINVFTDYDHPYALVKLIDQEPLVRSESELDYSVQRYEAIFTNATIGIIVADEGGQIVSANQLADQLFGYVTGELVGLAIDKLVPRNVSHQHEKLRQSFTANPQIRAMGHNRDLFAQRKDNSRFPVEVSLSYFRLHNTLYAVAYIIDITLKKEAEHQLFDQKIQVEQLNAELEQKVADRTHALMNTLAQLEQSKDELAQALKTERELGELKSRFVSMASHEFRTPLTVLQTSATLIEKYAGADQQDKRKKHLDRIRASIKQLNDTLEEFLSLGKVEEGKVEAHPIEVNVTQLINETVADMEGILKPDQQIQTDLSCIDPFWLDPSLLRKILVNLLANAIKYSGPGSTVTVRGTCTESQLTLAVEDQGVGIPKEDQQHLFERFFRAKNVANIAGTGLGLHIVGRYMELMGGQVLLQSALNKGTVVTLLLPYENHSAD